MSNARALTTTVYGDTLEELELTALDEARSLFGDTIRLALEPGYMAYTAPTHVEHKFYAHIRINVVDFKEEATGA